MYFNTRCEWSLSVSSYSHLDDIRGLRVRQRPVQQAATAHRFSLAVEGW